MKSTLSLIVVAGLALGHATKLQHANRKTQDVVQPKTAFCMTGNVREAHQEEPAKKLRGLIDKIDPDGMVFAYINPCESQTTPWWWEETKGGLKGGSGKPFIPKMPANGDCWDKSKFRDNVKPDFIKEYREADVAPVPRTWCPNSADFVRGAYQQWKGVQECFNLIKEYETKHNHTFETVVRYRADACKTKNACEQVSYCSIDKLDRQKAYLHDHATPNGGHHGEHPIYFDNFAILPRSYADVYFNTLDLYKDCSLSGPGEALLNTQMTTHHVPTEDMCECHNLCAPPGQALFIERRFQPDLETYEDVPVIEMVSQPLMNFAAEGENDTRAKFVKPAWMRFKLSPSPSKAQTA